jgi:hypothetical protein
VALDKSMAFNRAEQRAVDLAAELVDA